MKFFKKLFGSSNTNVPAKTAYEIGYSADSTPAEINKASVDLLNKQLGTINADKYDLFKGAADAMHEGRSDNMRVIVDTYQFWSPITINALAAEGISKEEFDDVFGKHPMKQTFLDKALCATVGSTDPVEKKISTLQKLVGIGAAANAFNSQSIRFAVIRGEDAVVNFLKDNNAKIEDALADALKHKDEVAAEKLSKYRFNGNYQVS